MGMDHFYRESVTKLMNTKPLIADIADSVESVAAAAMNRLEMLRNDCIIVTSGGTFAGVVYPSDLPQNQR
ncbi:hypothetical protein D3C73_1554470 [compost metagenome]